MSQLSSCCLWIKDTEFSAPSPAPRCLHTAMSHYDDNRLNLWTASHQIRCFPLYALHSHAVSLQKKPQLRQLCRKLCPHLLEASPLVKLYTLTVGRQGRLCNPQIVISYQSGDTIMQTCKINDTSLRNTLSFLWTSCYSFMLKFITESRYSLKYSI